MKIAIKDSIIAVDFDGVLCENAYPEIGKTNSEVISILKNLKRKGARLILWTCRCEEKLDQAVEWCKKRGLVFDTINENLPETILSYGTESRKVHADIYIDDKAMNPDYFINTMKQYENLTDVRLEITI